MMDTVTIFMNAIETNLYKTLVQYNPLRAPHQFKIILSRWLPYLVIASIVPNVLGLLITLEIYNNALISFVAAMGGFVSFYSPHAFATVGQSTFIMIVINTVWIVLLCLALPGLFRKTHMGWYYLFCATLVVVIESLLYLRVARLLFNTLFVWYLLFQVRQEYRN